jgi:hypothetical protein
MVVAVLVARVMKMPVHGVVDVIAVPDRHVLAGRPMLVIGGVCTASVRRCTGRTIHLVHVD